MVKSIIDIEINDGAFKRFQELFKKYQDELKKTSSEWSNAGEHADHLSEASTLVTAALLTQTELIKHLVKDQDGITQSERERLTIWGKLSRHSKEFSLGIRETTQSLLKWSAIGTVASGILGIGSLFGLDKIANFVGSGRRSALGLGTTYGQQKAFGINFSRLVDPNAYLGSISEVQGDISQQAGLYGLGFSQKQISGETSTQLGVQVLDRLRVLAQHTDNTLLAQTLQSRQLDRFISLEDFRRLKNTPNSEYQQLRRGYLGDTSALNLPPKTQKAFQDLSTQLERAGTRIETVFIDDIGDLAKPVGKLSAAFENAVDAFLKSRTVKEGMLEIADGLNQFAKYVGTPQFKQDIKTFVEDIDKVAKATVNALRWLGVIAQAQGPAAKDKSGIIAPKDMGLDITGHDVPNPPSSAGQAKANRWLNFIFRHGETQQQTQREDFIRKTAKQLGIDPDVAVKKAAKEGLYSSGVGDDGSSFGDFQLHVGGVSSHYPRKGLGDAFRKATGLDPSDPKNWQAEDKWYLEYAKKYGWHDLTSARGSPRYEGINRGTSIKIKVQNSTGGHVITQANQVAN